MIIFVSLCSLSLKELLCQAKLQHLRIQFTLEEKEKEHKFSFKELEPINSNHIYRNMMKQIS